MNPLILGFVRGIGFAVLAAALTYLGDINHISGILSPQVAAVIVALALAFEHQIEGKTGNALFGAVKTRK